MQPPTIEQAAWQLADLLPVVDGAACATHPEPWLWDDWLESETEGIGKVGNRIRSGRDERHRRALEVCGTCPAREACGAARLGAEGVWAGRAHSRNGIERPPKPKTSKVWGGEAPPVDRLDQMRVFSTYTRRDSGDGLSRDERAEVVRRWTRDGHSKATIADWLGLSARSVERIRRAGGGTAAMRQDEAAA